MMLECCPANAAPDPIMPAQDSSDSRLLRALALPLNPIAIIAFAATASSFTRAADNFGLISAPRHSIQSILCIWLT